MRLLADESCDFQVVVALREAGHDVPAIVEDSPGISDEAVVERARVEGRVIVAEDKDFGQLMVTGAGGPGVVLMRCPEAIRSELPRAIANLVDRFGDKLLGTITVWTPNHVRMRVL